MWVRIAADAAADWATDKHVPVTFVDLVGVPSAEELHQMIQGLKATHPDVDAIICLPEGLGVGILSILRELGHSVPDDIQLVSYTDSPTLPIVQPPISALDLRAKDAGMRAGELLISIIEGGGGAEHTIERFELIYRERSSTRPTRNQGSDVAPASGSVP
jgi:DNA-binding LacI/PurR family transcriptional regulator